MTLVHWSVEHHPPPPVLPDPPERAPVPLTLDGVSVEGREGETILDVARAAGIDVPVACYAENLTPVNACRLCVVELEGARTLVPACARRVEAGMVIETDSPRVRAARKAVLELLASSADLSAWDAFPGYAARYGVDVSRFGEAVTASDDDASPLAPPIPGHHHPSASPATARQAVKVDNDCYVRDYSRCILCYRCVEACGDDAQATYAISAAGRGFAARISTEFDVALPDSACVYCGNCVGVCPTGALMFASEAKLRSAGEWDPARQHTTETICPYCGVGCELGLVVQDDRIVKVTSPADHSVTKGNLCVKGRFGFDFVHAGREPPSRGARGAGEREG